VAIEERLAADHTRLALSSLSLLLPYPLHFPRVNASSFLTFSLFLTGGADAASWERVAIEERLAADRCADHARAIEFELNAARNESAKLAAMLAERCRETESLDEVCVFVCVGGYIYIYTYIYIYIERERER